MLWIALRAWPADAVSISAARASLACHALRYTPRVSLSHDAVLMEVAASLRLFGGLRSLLVQLREQVTREDLVEHSDNLQAAAGPTSLQALARLRAEPAHEPEATASTLKPENLRAERIRDFLRHHHIALGLGHFLALAIDHKAVR